MVLPVAAAAAAPAAGGFLASIGGLSGLGSAMGGIAALGGLFGKKGASKKDMWAQADIQYEFQRRLNQTAIRDRVNDAKAAGIHPLYAIGGNVNPGGMSMPVPSEGSRFADMGQNIERAVSAFDTFQQRKLLEESATLDIERKKLENSVLRDQAVNSRIRLQTQPGTPPPSPNVQHQPYTITGQGDTAGYEEGNSPSYSYIRTGTNTYQLAQGNDAKQKNEDDLLATWGWNFKHRISPPPPPYPAPAGKKWRFSHIMQEYELVGDFRHYLKQKYGKGG